ncbi:hypothetical protein Aeqsu_2893 [Aequorivita sublithincola DSM 14238]|uniref:Esterase/lipase superfamily enzyme n=1 Tax=Aequorivita sublithincola (strain DSM 14238 / LMG 21431 / ACAM 643 / 9-3) TaxID=746697 RepID=I3YZB6_AEQSU|nr:alpha/beta hydrolase [Aequorivita sublithincola]AFL82334.1 hypothetical protein Aeqsu_2893 [Aequorivita sublithincola DSM 14238]
METQLIFELGCTNIRNVQIAIDNIEIDQALWIKQKNSKWEMEYSIVGKRNIIVTIIITAEQNETATLQLRRKGDRENIGTYSLNVKKDNTAETKLVIFINKPYTDPFIFKKDIEAMPSPIPYPSMAERPPSVSRQTRSQNKKSIPPEAKDDGSFDVLVFFATDRNTYLKKNKIKFGVERGALKYGTVSVSIPRNRKLGDIPRPKWWKLQFRENADKYVMILEQKIIARNKFFRSLKETIATSDEKDAFVFMHGYNVSFDEAVMRTAQIAHDVSFKGAPICYSWPSRASVDGYISDLDNVEYSHKHILQFLKDLQQETKAKKLHLIAHSMGNRALTRALVELQEENYFKEETKFTQIILAAPDIDAQIFINDIAPMLLGSTTGQVTLYVSSKDKALGFSRNLRKHLRRAGDGGENIVCAKGIETIDASQVDTNFIGHGYFAETKSLLDDITTILEKNETPDERKLKSIVKNNFTYWTF